MSNIASGSKSSLIWTEEASYGVFPTGVAFATCPFDSESLDEQINKIVSNEIRPDRTVPAIRGGNILCGGGVNTDFACSRFAIWLKHLLASTPATTNLVPVALVNAMGTILRGQYVTSSGNLYVALNGGTYTGATNGASHTSGATTVGTIKFDFVSAGVACTAVNATETFTTTATISLTTAQSVVVTATTLPTGVTAATEYFVGGISSNSFFLYDTAAHATTGGATGKVAISSDGVAIKIIPTPFKHVLTAGVNFPTVGLSAEKRVKGAGSDLYVAFQGIRINSLGITVPQEGIVQAAWSFLAIDTLSGTATNVSGGSVASPAGEDPVMGTETYFSFDQLTNRPARDINFTINNNIEENVLVVGSRTRRGLPENRRETMGRVTMFFEDTTEYDAFKNETVKSVYISMCHNGRYIEFRWDEVKFTGTGTPKVGGSGVITADYEMSAFYQSGAIGTDVRVTIIDSLASLT